MYYKKTSQSGLSLIEICIALIVVGLLMIPVIYEYDQEISAARIQTTRTNFLSLSNALQQYFYANNRLPCPANILLRQSDPLYGHETVALNCAGPGVTPDGATKVAKGDVPFAALNLPWSETIDGWGNKIAYVVTIKETVAPLVPTDAAIQVTYYQDDQGNLDTNSPDTVSFLLASYGDDGAGAYTPDGVLNKPCPVAAPVSKEAINCSNGTQFLRRDYVVSKVPGVNYYDDFVDATSYLKNLDSQVWAYSPPDPANGVPPYTNIFSSGYIGINTGPNTTVTYPVQVNGNALILSAAAPSTTLGNAYAGTYCDATSTPAVPDPILGSKNCFPSRIIGGSGMGAGLSPSCSADAAMTGIAGNNGGNPDFALCGAIKYATTSKGCPDPTKPYVTGFTAAGDVQCGP